MKRETKVQYSLSFSRKRRTILIKMDDDGGVKVLAPHGTSKNKIEEVLLQHSAWIEKRQTHLKGLEPPLVEHTYKDGDLFLLHDKLLTLVVNKSNTNKVSVRESILIVDSMSISKASIKKLIEEYYDEYGLTLYNKLVSKWIIQLGLTKIPYTVSMATYPKRLGSCSSHNNLSFARRSLMMPIELLDYLALHEVAHLVYFNHSRDFKNLLFYHMGDYKERFNTIKSLRLKIAHL
ncbi:MAG: DUF45 domain-containing protein [Spirochaetia bacterium]|nr:DUF45 domain-containing protein [Spirochaetia bacterium]